MLDAMEEICLDHLDISKILEWKLKLHILMLGMMVFARITRLRSKLESSLLSR